MVVATVLSAPPALAVEIEAPPSVKSGEPFHVVARLVNQSETSVTIVRPDVLAGPLGVGYGGGLFREACLVSTTLGGLQALQIVEPWSYGPWAFQTLRPGESVKIEDIVYRKVYVQGKAPSLKSELRTMPIADLVPGAYTLQFSYSFHPEFHKNIHRWGKGAPPRALTAEGRALYKTAWTGRVVATAPIIVSGV